MNEILKNIDIIGCNYKDIEIYVSEYYGNNKIIVDSFWYGHVRESNFYKIEHDKNTIGYFGIHNGTVLVLFNIFENYRNISQEIFITVRKYESVKEALILTGDEFFISHAIDNYTRIEKQAYFSIYTNRKPQRELNIKLQLTNVEKDKEILNLCYDFLKEEIKNIKNARDEKIYIAWDGNEVIGFGVIEYQKVVSKYASIGMIVREEYRKKWYGSNILQKLKEIVNGKEYTAVSRCWYYNHNSKRQWRVSEHIQRLRFYF
jgi:GNAT superfamily N-acetyltransferase